MCSVFIWSNYSILVPLPTKLKEICSHKEADCYRALPPSALQHYRENQTPQGWIIPDSIFTLFHMAYDSSINTSTHKSWSFKAKNNLDLCVFHQKMCAKAASFRISTPYQLHGIICSWTVWANAELYFSVLLTPATRNLLGHSINISIENCCLELN